MEVLVWLMFMEVVAAARNIKVRSFILYYVNIGLLVQASIRSLTHITYIHIYTIDNKQEAYQQRVPVA